jgi:two-component system chemotaxis sensor kinase CheA
VDPFESIKATFFQECDELLADLENGLIAMEGGDKDPETVNAVFRAVHSVKGGAGAFGLDALVRFSHAFETLLDELRSDRKACSEEIIKALLRASDVLADHVQEARGGAAVDEGRSAALRQELETLAGAEAAPAAGLDEEIDDFDFQPVQLDMGAETPTADAFDPIAAALAAALAAPDPQVAAPTTWTIRFQPRTDMYLKANETALILRELARLGPMRTTLDDSAVMTLDSPLSEEACLAWTVLLDTDAGAAMIREAFEFVEDDCDLSIEPYSGEAEVPAIAIGLEMIEEAPAVIAASADQAFDVAGLLAMAQAADSDFGKNMDKAKAAVAPPAAPAMFDTRAASPAAPAQTTIRVDLERVDRLIDVVGELVIQQAMLSQRVVESGLARSSNVAMGLDDLEQLTREIQDSVMAIRAQPVKSVFQRMPRLVRECADMTGKKVRLVTEGEGTEVDKTVIERLTDPITHMLRNAIDHGLETPEQRLAAGKPVEGVVRLIALHRSGRIVIEVQDDGRGIDRERVRGIAVSKGLIDPDATLTEEEIDNLIFLPGFSTATTVSDLSGRGVGMDVVRRSVQALGGRISITSNPGLGSKFTLSLPLTLAVLDGMVVEAAGQTLVAPLTAIVESLTPRREDIHHLGGRDAVIRVRDAFVPLIDVGVALGFRDDPVDPVTGVAVLVEGEGGETAALLVDAIHGQRQVVIKSLEANYQSVEGVAAATILGDGRVALILDVDTLVTSSRRKTPRVELRMAG